MPRKSLAKERREQLLDAFERCIVKFGLEGTSLEQVAEEAGMKRSIIRHYIGNRDDLVNALIERIILQYTEQLAAGYADLSPQESISTSIDVMFAQKAAISNRDKIIIDVLMSAKERYPNAKSMLTRMYEAIIDSFADDLQKAYPKASRTKCRGVAYSLICLSEMNETFMWLGLNAQYSADARAVAEDLLSLLE